LNLQYTFKLIILSLGLTTLSAYPKPTVESDEANRPNVIIVMTDDQGYGDLSAHGNPILKTPNLDKLSAESVRFNDFHVSPFCTPTRAALMTGNHPGYTGAFRTSSGRTMMHPDEKTMANLFADSGYATGMIGKWHLGDNAPHRPQDRGFHDVVWHRAGAVGQAPDYWGNDYFDDVYERNGEYEQFEGYVTDIWFRESLKFIEKNKEKPFFLYLSLNAPHGPYFVPEKWEKPYLNNRGVYNSKFYGMIANIDHNMGILRSRLAELDLDENTILIFMTDNGTAKGAKFKGLDSEAVVGHNAGMRGKKSSIYDGGHRVPFFIHWPKGGLQGGRDIDTLAAHIDVLPTLADLTNIEVPASFDVDGLSLGPLLENSNEPWPRDHLVVQFHGGARAVGFPLQPLENSVVLTERWRLVNSKKEELYDIQKDPSQRNNVLAKHPDVVKELRALYQPFWERVSPRMTDPVRIDIGNPNELKTVLSSQDWYMKKGNPPWSFGMIKRLPKVTGPWFVDVKQAGSYKLTLRQWPLEAGKPIKAEHAVLKISGLEKSSAIKPGSLGVEFNVDLPAGPTKLLTYLHTKDGKVGGAYFVNVEWLGNAK
jgi:arylsulfatase A-like enzyme